MKRFWLLLLLLLVAVFFGYRFSKKVNFNSYYSIGQAVDSLNGVAVYYNGGVEHVLGRNVAADGYNLGLKYQCVEFVKRYYYEHFNHKMPDSYGHAKSFFDASLTDGQLNEKRGLLQFSNGSTTPPQVGDLIVFDGTLWNAYGHVAIVSGIGDHAIEIIQQNPGPYGTSRETIPLKREGTTYYIGDNNLLGWLRLAP